MLARPFTSICRHPLPVPIPAPALAVGRLLQVLDVHRLMKGHQSDVLWVMEQIPGSTEAADVTSTLLQQGFWPSYNVPYFPRIYNLSGWPADKDLHSSAPRALLFAREQQRVASTQDMQAVMRLNR